MVAMLYTVRMFQTLKKSTIFLKKNKISYKISNQPEMLKVLKNLFSKNDRSKKVQKKLFLIGQEVLKRTYDNVDLLIKNETSKT